MTRRRLLPCAGLVGLAVVLASLTGCGSDSDSSAPTPTPTPTATVTQTVTADPSETPTEAPTETPDGLPTTYDDAAARIASGTETGRELTRFVTSSGIYCGLAVGDAYAGCELADGLVEDPEACGDAPSRFVGRIEIQAGAGVPVCNTDTIRTEGAATLPDGSVATTRDTQCLADGDAVTCISRSGSGGFSLAPGEYHVF